MKSLSDSLYRLYSVHSSAWFLEDQEPYQPGQTLTSGRTRAHWPQWAGDGKEKETGAVLCIARPLRRTFRRPISSAVRTQRPTLPTFTSCRRNTRQVCDRWKLLGTTNAAPVINTALEVHFQMSLRGQLLLRRPLFQRHH